MKKILSLLLSMVLVISSFSGVVFANDEIKILLNGSNLTMDQPPIIVAGRTLVPLRAIFEALGATVSWDDGTRCATGVLGGTTVSLQIDNTAAKVNGNNVTLDVPAQIVNSRTLVPVRFISESLGCKVDWNDATRTVIITGAQNSLLDLTFDNMQTFEANKDFIIGGNYKADKVSLSTELDHTTGSGKSVKMADRNSIGDRLKIKDATKGMEIGEEYIVSAYVYVPGGANAVSIGMYGDKGTDYAYKSAARKQFDIPKDTWTKIEVSYKHENEIVTQIGFEQTNSSVAVASVIYVDDVKVTAKNPKPVTPQVPVNPTTPTQPSVSGGELNLTFDNITELVNNVDVVMGGSYKFENISVTNEVDYTTGSGKSVKMANREKASNRLKFKNAFNGAQAGQTYIITAYVYTLEDAQVGIGVYGDQGTSSASSPAKSKKEDVKANTWTKLELTYKYDNAEITQVGIDQRSSGAKVASTIYVDDVRVQLKDGQSSSTPSTAHKTVNVNDIAVTLRDGKRPTPKVENVGKTYDDLIFYERTFETTEKKDSEEMFSLLPKNPKVVKNNTDMLSATLSGAKYVDIEKISVEGMPFNEAIRAKVKVVPPYAYNAQLRLKKMDETAFEDGDNMLAIFYMRTIDVENEFGEGQVQLVVEQDVRPNAKALQENVTTLAGGDWKKVYLPFTAKAGYPCVNIRIGYYVQTVEFGGYQLLNYGKDVKFEDLPSDTSAVEYLGEDIFDKNTQWRRDAWARIEQIRRGDINVIVKDAAGNVIPNADVKVDMYDHEFNWGTAMNGNLIKEDSEHAKNYQYAASMMFNAAVSEGNHKPVVYFKDPDKAKQLVQKAKDLGIKYYRGHTILMDQKYHETYDEKNDAWIENSTVSEELLRLQLANDKAGIDKYMENTIKTIVGQTKGTLTDWDVINEVIARNQMYSTYGMEETVKKWFKWAREADPDVKLYYNECKVVGIPSNQYLKNMKVFIDEMIAHGVDFDGIGVQGHLGLMPVSPYDFYQEVIELAKYGKEMKITEFDVKDKEIPDDEFEASYTRDVMILMFSIENMNGFLMWGFNDKNHWLKNAPLFDGNWNLKLSGEQYVDLVYNKWWTQEEGKTDANGSFSTKGYYGDYLITASANGKSATVDVQCHKGNNNTIEIVLK